MSTTFNSEVMANRLMHRALDRHYSERTPAECELADQFARRTDEIREEFIQTRADELMKEDPAALLHESDALGALAVNRIVALVQGGSHESEITLAARLLVHSIRSMAETIAAREFDRRY
jgi:hypothetical protein